MQLNKPDFIIIGAAKSGTTTLYKYLCRHPQIFMSTPKEPDFFAVDAHYAKGMEWYSSLFAQAKPGQICGEASTTYSRWQQHPHAAARIAKALPNVKLIYIMRHPIDRAYSFYLHRLKGARHKPELAVLKTFEKTIAQQSEFLDSSYYLEQIERYLQFFPRESFLFLLLEDLYQQPAATLKKILRFINADPNIDLIQDGLVKANKANDHPEWLVKKQLMAPLKAIPGVGLLSKILPVEARDRAYSIVKKISYQKWQERQYVPPAMESATRDRLLNLYHQPNQELANFLNRDLSHWSI